MVRPILGRQVRLTGAGSLAIHCGSSRWFSATKNIDRLRREEKKRKRLEREKREGIQRDDAKKAGAPPDKDEDYIPIPGFKSSDQTRRVLQAFDTMVGGTVRSRIDAAMAEDSLSVQDVPDEWLENEDLDMFLASVEDADALPEALRAHRWLLYLAQRGFLDTDNLLVETESACKMFVSYYMTYPMTLAYAWNDLIDSSGDETPKTIGVLGADLEVDHLVLWQELPFLKVMDPIKNPISFHFVGPEVVESTEEKPGGHGIGTMHMTKGVVQDAGHKLEECDAFTLFQPGAGTNPDYTWNKAIPHLLDLNRPMLVTAHNQDDANRDNNFWKAHLGSEIVYQENPWASCSYEPLLTSNNGYFGIYKP